MLKNWIYLGCIVPILLGLVWWLRPDLIVGEEWSYAMIWTLVGVLFSYLGFLFSVYAVVEVRSLSNRYFTKQRIPDIEKQLSSVVKKLMSPNDLTLGDMQSDSSVGEAAVLLRALDSLKLSELTEALRKAKESHSKIEHILSQGLNKAIQAKKVTNIGTLRAQ